MHNFFSPLIKSCNINPGNIADFADDLLDNCGFGVAVIDAETHQVIFANSEFLSISGCTREEISDKTCNNLSCKAKMGECPVSDLGKIVNNAELEIMLADGSLKSIIKNVVQVNFENKTYLIESVIDNSERKAVQDQLVETNEKLKLEINKHKNMQEQIKKIAYHDSLTGLPNGTLFSKHLDHAIAQASRAEVSLAVMLLHLDDIRRINDTMGQSVGDYLVREVAERLSKTLRISDIIARFGEDEFIVLIENIVNMDALDIISDKIFGSLSHPFEVDDLDLSVSTSMGIAVYPTDGTVTNHLIKNAVLAMYKAKEKGLNEFVLRTPMQINKVIETVKLGNQLYRAIDRNELLLYYQPQIDCSSNEINGLEALIRWNHPEFGLVNPAKFIPLADQSSFIKSIGEWVIRTACKQNKEWQRSGLPHIPVSVNLSLHQFQNPDIVGQIKDILLETDLDPKYLELEIKESVIMGETENAVQTLELLRNEGLTLTIDDFSVKYSSLDYLKLFPADKIKIESPFIENIDCSKKEEAGSKDIITQAKQMGLRVIAKGVETEAQLSYLKQQKCDDIQGDLYYAAMPADVVKKLLTIALAQNELMIV